MFQTVSSAWRVPTTPYVPDWLPNTSMWTRCVRCWTIVLLRPAPKSSRACRTTRTPASTCTTHPWPTSRSWEYRCVRERHAFMQTGTSLIHSNVFFVTCVDPGVSRAVHGERAGICRHSVGHWRRSRGVLRCCALWHPSTERLCAFHFSQWERLFTGDVIGGCDHVPSLLFTVGQNLVMCCTIAGSMTLENLMTMIMLNYIL